MSGYVTLKCKHTVRFTPAPPVAGEPVYCMRCRTYQDVLRIEDPVTVRCADCIFSRVIGVEDEDQSSTREATRVASRHVTRRPSHTVYIRSGGVQVGEPITNSGQGELPFERATADRVAETKDHQRSLKSLSDRYLGRLT